MMRGICSEFESLGGKGRFAWERLHLTEGFSGDQHRMGVELRISGLADFEKLRRLNPSGYPSRTLTLLLYV